MTTACLAEMMRVYYVDTPLSDDEVQEIEQLMDWQVEQVRVPFLLPVDDQRWQDAPAAPLKAAGILKDYDRRCGFVQMSTEPLYRSTSFIETIGRLTGRWPYLVQTDASRASIENYGELRVLDMDAAMRDLMWSGVEQHTVWITDLNGIIDREPAASNVLDNASCHRADIQPQWTFPKCDGE